MECYYINTTHIATIIAANFVLHGVTEFKVEDPSVVDNWMWNIFYPTLVEISDGVEWVSLETSLMSAQTYKRLNHNKWLGLCISQHCSDRGHFACLLLHQWMKSDWIKNSSVEKEYEDKFGVKHTYRQEIETYFYCPMTEDKANQYLNNLLFGRGKEGYLIAQALNATIDKLADLIVC